MSTQRILIVDDDPAVLLTLAASIERLNAAFVVDTCESGAEALIYLENRRYGLLLTDYSMPGMSGLALAQIVRERAPDTRIIMMTAYGNTTLREQAAELRLDAFVDKPFTVKQLREIINRVMNEKAVENKTASERIFSRTPSIAPPLTRDVQGSL